MSAAERLVWAAQNLDPSPDQHLLEIGCGHGVSLTLVCERLTSGTVTGLDRSPTMIAAAARRNAAHLASGRLRLHTTTLAGADLGDARFGSVFAARVGLFWRGDPGAEHASSAGTSPAAGGCCSSSIPRPAPPPCPTRSRRSPGWRRAGSA